MHLPNHGHVKKIMVQSSNRPTCVNIEKVTEIQYDDCLLSTKDESCKLQISLFCLY